MADVVVVDGGSTDGTSAVATQYGAHVVQQRERGYGGALLAGFAATSTPWIVTMDADLSHRPSFLAALWSRRHEADILIASRYVPGATVRRPLLRRAMSNVYRWLVRTIVPTGLQDTQCGGKAYTAEAARALFTRQTLPGFAFDAEILFLARRLGYRVVEVPFALVQPHGSSTHLLRDAPRMVRDLVLIRWRAFRGSYR